MNSLDSEGLSPSEAERIEELFHHALEVPAGDQAAFLASACDGDRRLEESVRSLLRAGRETRNSWDRGALEMEARHSAFDLSPTRSGEFIGPYRVTKCIGAGGMGSVYEALRDDAEFHKRVAIKFVRQGFDDSAAIERFRSERQILAQLEHPNIARLLDGGSTPEGVPYLVMEYVDGEPIDRFVTRRGLGRSERLKLFLQVCEAVQQAHRNLVVHRDLKPGNILVTPEGVPKLLDFGIAKLLNQESNAATLQALTPEHASPEQLRGQSITTATDIYSLGVLLFILLADRLPYRATASQPVELVRSICEEEPAWDPPGLIEGDLYSILSKALHKDPRHRYLSVEQLAADVQRYQGRLPVLARPPSRWYHATRFCARNKALSVTAAALVVAIVAGFAATAWQARRAAQQAQLAQRRFSEARRLIYSVIHDIEPRLASIEGTIAVRASMVDQTVGYLEALGKDAGDSPALIRELIEGYLELAKLTGGGSDSNVGNVQRAGQILKKAEALLDKLLRIEPSDPAAIQLAILVYRSVGLQEVQYGSEENGRAYTRRAVEAAERLSVVSGQDSRSQEAAAQAFMALAGVVADTDTDQAISLYERSASIWNRGLTEHPTGVDTANLRQRLALAYRSLSNSWVGKKDYPRGIELAAKAREIDQDLLTANPSAPTAQMNLAFDLGALAYAYDEAADYKRAVEAQRSNVQLREKIVAANSDDFRASERLGYALRFLAATEERAGQKPAARRDYLRAVEVYSRLRKKGILVQGSLIEYARSILGVVRIGEQGATTPDRCKWIRTMADLLKDYETRAPLAPDTYQVDQMRQAILSCGL